MSELLKGLRTNCSNPDWITVELRRTVTGCLYEIFCSATHQVNTGLIAPYFISTHHNAQQRINGRRHRGRDQVYLSGTPMLVSL